MMYCSNCGEKAGADSKFCVRCGQLLGVPPLSRAPAAAHTAPAQNPPAAHTAPAQNPSGFRAASGIDAAAVHLKVGTIKREPWILWIGPQKSALICIDRSRYPFIGYGGTIRKDTAEQNFRNYALEMKGTALENVLAAHPGSISFDTAQIQRMEIYITYDDDTNRYDDYERFILDTPAGKYRGSFERGMDLIHMKQILKELLSGRYKCRTMSGYPFL